jgi:SAM-dependent methyltransferase
MSDSKQTIADFGEQWSHYGDNEGRYGSVELLQDMLGPLLRIEELRGTRVADIGSGTGRIVRMLLAAGAARVTAVEPSAGVEALRDNTRDVADRVEIIHAAGDALPSGLDLDFVISIGVIQFIPNPQPTLRAARAALRRGGKLVIWVYAVEGNRAYVAAVTALRAITTRLPHPALAALSWILTWLLEPYMALCRWVPLPMRDYMRQIFARVDREKRRLTIYDQLNPSYSRYYRREEVKAMLEQAGFTDVRLYHRHHYSWTASGIKSD